MDKEVSTRFSIEMFSMNSANSETSNDCFEEILKTDCISIKSSFSIIILILIPVQIGKELKLIAGNNSNFRRLVRDSIYA